MPVAYGDFVSYESVLTRFFGHALQRLATIGVERQLSIIHLMVHLISLLLYHIFVQE